MTRVSTLAFGRAAGDFGGFGASEHEGTLWLNDAPLVDDPMILRATIRPESRPNLDAVLGELARTAEGYLAQYLDRPLTASDIHVASSIDLASERWWEEAWRMEAIVGYHSPNSMRRLLPVVADSFFRACKKGWIDIYVTSSSYQTRIVVLDQLFGLSLDKSLPGDPADWFRDPPAPSSLGSDPLDDLGNLLKTALGIASPSICGFVTRGRQWAVVFNLGEPRSLETRTLDSPIKWWQEPIWDDVPTFARMGYDFDSYRATPYVPLFEPQEVASRRFSRWVVQAMNRVLRYLLAPTNFRHGGVWSVETQMNSLKTFFRISDLVLLIESGLPEYVRRYLAFDCLDQLSALRSRRVAGAASSESEMFRALCSQEIAREVAGAVASTPLGEPGRTAVLRAHRDIVDSVAQPHPFRPDDPPLDDSKAVALIRQLRNARHGHFLREGHRGVLQHHALLSRTFASWPIALWIALLADPKAWLPMSQKAVGSSAG